MAKLENVVITEGKVRHNGIEYVKVDDTPKNGDLLLILSSRNSDVTIGAFYECESMLARCPIFLDDAGDETAAEKDNYYVFRKVVDKTLREGMLITINLQKWREHGTEDDITEGKTYEIVTKHETLGFFDDIGDFRYSPLECPETYEIVSTTPGPQYKAEKGDIIVITGNGQVGEVSPHGFNNGTILEVINSEYKGDDGIQGRVQAVDSHGVEFWIVHKFYRRATANEEKSFRIGRYKVGDYARLKKNGMCLNGFEPNDIVKITRIDNGETYYPLQVTLVNGDGSLGTTGHTFATNLEFVHESGVPKPKKVKVGDVIRITNDVSEYLTVGKTYVVYEGHWGDLCIADDDGDEYDVDYLGNEDFEILSEYEAQLVRLGRKKGEYKVGDLVEITKDQNGGRVGTIVKVKEVFEEDVSYFAPSRSNSGNTILYYSSFDGIKLVAPVESTL